ncbi:MAG: dehydrogenase, partial [Bacteroidota bacterium]
MRLQPTSIIALCLLLCFLVSCTSSDPSNLIIKKDSHIALLGGNLCSRMMNFGHFETEIQVRYPDSALLIRNMCDGGNTAGFRPHSSRNTPWAFPDAAQFQAAEFTRNSGSEGHLEYPDEWLTNLETDIILAFFGYSESFRGEEGIEDFKEELRAFVDHSFAQQYNGDTTLQFALISPTAFEDLSDQYDLPDGTQVNENLLLYTQAMKEVA